MRDRALPLDQRLFEQAFEYDFFQAVRLLHLMENDRPGVGRIAQPQEEPVRFKVRQSLEFPPSTVYALSLDRDPPEMTVSFFGLTGVQGALPHHYTEHILARAVMKDFAMAEFFDLFNHRLISLFYRAWEKLHFPVRFQLAAAHGDHDDVTLCLFDWIGLGTGGLRGRLSLIDDGLLRYAGLLRQRPACAANLGAILRDYFGVPVAIQEFIGGWYTLNPADQCDLASEDLNNKLGEGAIAGDAVWDPQARFCVRLGPLDLSRFLLFLPDGRAVMELRDLVRFYVGPILQFDLQLMLKADQVPWCELGNEGAGGPRLGWCAWLKTEPFASDAGDALFGIN